MKLRKITKTITFQYDEERFQNWLLKEYDCNTVEEYEKINSKKFPTCEEFLAKAKIEDIEDMYQLGYFHKYYDSPFILDYWISEEEKFEKVLKNP